LPRAAAFSAYILEFGIARFEDTSPYRADTSFDILLVMTFEVTATRRRPKTFDELAGQEFVSATLRKSIEAGKIAHAYLFSGPRGCGKTSAARILARSLNCGKGAGVEPCGVCSNCVEISKGSSLDVIEIDGASNTSVNDVRQIKDEVLFPPNSSRYKVYIIDEVHMLSNSAFNALLKTIEEPPPYIVFIFATTELHKVPATIKSRCQQFAFKLIPVETIKELLSAACEELSIEAEDEALFWIARESTGSLRDAYTLFDQVASFSEGHIRAALIREKLGLAGLDNLNALAEICASSDTGAAFALLDEFIENGVSVEQLIIDLAGFYRSLLLLKSGVTKESLLGYAPERFSAKALETLSVQRLEQAVKLLLETHRSIRCTVSPRFELETTIAELCALPKWVSQDDLRSAIEGARSLFGAKMSGVPAANIRHETSAEKAESAPGYSESPENKVISFSGEFKRRIAARENSGARQEAENVIYETRESILAPEVKLVEKVFQATVVK
jgi:DNA polymerase-3 subunit gamma/tau